jgi:hypothetical protein
MGDFEKMNEPCKVCDKPYSPDCDWQQGRCPHHPPLLNIQPRDTSPGHFYVSIVKSMIRIGAGGALIAGHLFFAGALLIFAEILGIVEELV